MRKISLIILIVALIVCLAFFLKNLDKFFDDVSDESNQTEVKDENDSFDNTADNVPSTDVQVPVLDNTPTDDVQVPTVDNISDDTVSEDTTEYIAVTDFSLSFNEISLTVGDRVMPIVTVYPQNAANKEEMWSSSDSSVATVDGIGNITAVSVGECVITVTSKDNESVFETVKVKVVAGIECTYIDGILIVNKTYPLPKTYAPGWETEATPHLWEMIRDAEAEGIKLWMTSGYRSWYDQQYIYNGYVAEDGQEAADRYSARPGHSEHQTGLAYDLNDLSHDFGDTPEGKWVAENCHKYGFIVRYPKEKEDITGYIYEPWHIRYLGVEKATEVYESGLCLEEFLGITSVYSY